MDTIAELVEKWYGERQDFLSEKCERLFIRSYEPLDRSRGQVEIGIETNRVLASLSFWNKGDITVIMVDKVDRSEHILTDRTLTPDEDIRSLLSHYTSRILNQGNTPTDEN